ncbi:MAG TPA: hypothetical protein VK508_12570 [Cyclobacteriaceae bacterium]|nr:hypothetical protein [Cyclobacteriaceae bacterium]
MKDRPLTYCCDSIKFHLDQFFKEPDDVDTIIKYVAVFDEYGIPIRDGGSSFIHIEYCPWCGAKLPPSKRDEWFKKLEDLGYESPLTDEVPEEFKSSDWYREP